MFHTAAPASGGYSLKTRLNAIIAFLALLPVCGVLAGLIALYDSAHNNAAMDRAARGTIHLERINGLVYNVVMESRGIYMSADWNAAEKFARNLLPALAELQEVARAWKADAIVSQQSNVEELGRRIDDFVRFRTELVRLGREESTAAARAFGDNDANRTVRTALNQSLASLARAYEQEISRARSLVEADERYFMLALVILAVLAVIAYCGALVLVRISLLAPLLQLKDRMFRIARGNLDDAVDQRHPAAEIGDMAQVVEGFRTDLLDRQRLNHQSELLSSLNEWLQSCNSLTELYDMVGSFLAKLLPGCSGNLFIYANSRDILESTQAWNGAKKMPAMHPDDCWALRRGRTYTFGMSDLDFACMHVGAAHPEPYCCIPVLAHGETIGLLHLQFGADSMVASSEASESTMVAQRRLGIVCAEQISLAIANAKLRDQLRDQSIRDPLTGLFNRRYLLETCRREFARATRAGQSVSVLSIDVDHFKKFNDNHGHDAGDTVLRAVGNCLDELFRAEDVPCRFGGEEFVVILPGADIDAALHRAEQLRSKVEGLTVRYLEKNLPRITISVGVAAFPEAGDTPQAVLRVADTALYQAKANGRNRVERLGGAAVPADEAIPAPSAQEPRPVLFDAADG